MKLGRFKDFFFFFGMSDSLQHQRCFFFLFTLSTEKHSVSVTSACPEPSCSRHATGCDCLSVSLSDSASRDEPGSCASAKKYCSKGFLSDDVKLAHELWLTLPLKTIGMFILWAIWPKLAYCYIGVKERLNKCNYFWVLSSTMKSFCGNVITGLWFIYCIHTSSGYFCLKNNGFREKQKIQP